MPAAPVSEPSVESSWRNMVSGKHPLSAVGIPFLGILSLPYSAAVRMNWSLYRSGILRQSNPPLPVVSVGNISLGGTGKTTVCSYLARRFMQANLRPGIVLRGYGRRGNGPLLVSDGPALNATPEDAGDEAWLLAQMLPECPVAVAKRRERAVQMLHERTEANIVLFDDGFQYYRMARDIDLVLLDAARPPGSERLFPAGYLREPYSHLARATDVWITHCNVADETAIGHCEQIAEKHAPQAAVARTSHVMRRLTDWSGNEVELEALRGYNIVAVAGLGNPQSFFDMVERLVQRRIQTVAFDDHHRYTPQDWERISDAVGEDPAVVTTPKDAVKLPDPPERLHVHVLHPTIRIETGQEACADLIQRARRAVQ